MPGLDPNVVVYLLAINSSKRPIKKHPRKASHDIVEKKEEEVEKMLKVRFIHEVWYLK